MPREVKERRLDEVLKVSNGIADRKNAKLLHAAVEVLAEKNESGFIEGRTRQNKKVFFKGNACNIGKLLMVRIAEVKINTLKGVIVS